MDTSPEINAMIFDKVMKRTSSERLLMGLDMQATARALVWSSIPAGMPEAERRRAFYQWFYGEACPL